MRRLNFTFLSFWNGNEDDEKELMSVRNWGN